VPKSRAGCYRGVISRPSGAALNPDCTAVFRTEIISEIRDIGPGVGIDRDTRSPSSLPRGREPVTSQAAAAAGTHSGTPARAGEPPSFDTSVAHPARVYDYLLGGKDNYEADRKAAEEIMAISPAVVTTVRANRAFLRRAVRYLAGEAGIRQFLDIGTGLPTAENTHEVAQAIAPECRGTYVDNDPIVLAHARVLLTSIPEGATAYIDADVPRHHAAPGRGPVNRPQHHPR
jgi:hypothetical protein